TCWSSYFDDFPMVSHAATATSTLASTKDTLRLQNCRPLLESCNTLMPKSLGGPAASLCMNFGISDMFRGWRRDGAHHVIGIIELYAMVTALLHWKHAIASRQVLIFVDNWSALDPSKLAMTCVWAARVPSKSNISDGPSRACLKELGQFAPQPLCPITGHMLR
ncbi:unnamed protein product, partial [Effrenium voratum]